MAWHDSFHLMKRKRTETPARKDDGMDWPADEDLEDTAPATQSERLDVPAGTHEFQIKQVINDTDQLEVRLVHDDRRYGWVFLRLQRGAKWANVLATQMRKALGISSDEWKSLEYDDLVGRRLLADIRHKPKPSGGNYVNVWSFSALPDEPQPERTPTPQPVARTPAAKVKAAAPGITNDDIPF
jgi:hypothetical protein